MNALYLKGVEAAQGTIRKLCEPCAKDTAVYGRCERLECINKPGTICDRCLRDGRLLVSYRVCCEPESRFGHTVECKKTRRRNQDPTLLRFASSLFCTDLRVLKLVGESYGDAIYANEDGSMCLGTDKRARIERLGRAWDLATDGHEPEATYRKEAEDRAFQMRRMEKELDDYGVETKRLTRESAAKALHAERLASLKAGQEANARLAPPLPYATHQENLRQLQQKEAEEHRLYSLQELQKKQAEDEWKKQEREAQRAKHVVCRARVVTRDPPPQGDLIVRGTATYDGPQIGTIEKGAIVDIVRHPEETIYHAYVSWRGGQHHPKVHGFVLRKHLDGMAPVVECGCGVPIGKGNMPSGSAFAEERCTRAKHFYGDHQFVVDDKVLSAWNGNNYAIVDELGGKMTVIEPEEDSPMLGTQLTQVHRSIRYSPMTSSELERIARSIP